MGSRETESPFTPAAKDPLLARAIPVSKRLRRYRLNAGRRDLLAGLTVAALALPSGIFVGDTRFVLDNLNTLGWVLIILGVIQPTAGFSLMAGNTYGRVLGIIGGSLGAIGALFSIGGAYPWWSLAVFALCIYVVHGIIVFGEDERAAGP